jgi:thiosulfate reductase cytochrome b subunit
MKKPTHTFSQARDAFLKALTDYQSATRDMTFAIKRMNDHTHKLYVSLNDVVHTSGSMITPRS